MKKIINGIFITAILLIFLAGLARTIFFPVDINEYENRYANKISDFSIASFMDSSFQDSVESGLMDQVHLSKLAKKVYNNTSSEYLRMLMIPIIKNNTNKYISLGKVTVFGGKYLTYSTYNISTIAAELDKNVEIINKEIEDLPELDFYVYYIERDVDINFETNEKQGCFEYLKDCLNLPDNHMIRFEIDNFDEYSKYFYRTDHHWSYQGSYKGYSEIIKLLGITDEPIKPIEEVTLPYSFIGSKSRNIGYTGSEHSIFTDDSFSFEEVFTAYRFDYPNMDISIDGEPADDYGNQDDYFAGTPETISYGAFYGADLGEIIFDTHNPDKENLLIIGDSYDNAILKLVASHFNRTYSIDTRYYSPSNGDKFNLSEYIKGKDISKVLLLGSVSFFRLEDFTLEG